MRTNNFPNNWLRSEISYVHKMTNYSLICISFALFVITSCDSRKPKSESEVKENKLMSCVNRGFLEVQPELVEGPNALLFRIASNDPELNKILESNAIKEVSFWDNSGIKTLESPVDYIGKMKVRKLDQNHYELFYPTTAFSSYFVKSKTDTTYYNFEAPRLKIVEVSGKSWILNQCHQ